MSCEKDGGEKGGESHCLQRCNVRGVHQHARMFLTAQLMSKQELAGSVVEASTGGQGGGEGDTYG